MVIFVAEAIQAIEMSTLRMQRGEPFVTIHFIGPKGGYRGMARLDLVEAAQLAAAISDAVQQAETQ
jgi:hypothetical protein